MKLGVYAVLDLKAAYYASVHTMRNDAEAIRSFENACREKGSSLYSNPEDYRLCRVGTFDDNMGAFEWENMKGPKELYSALQARVDKDLSEANGAGDRAGLEEVTLNG